jgi:hypothetical protein
MADTANMTKYTLDCPDVLWDAWKETVPRRYNLNDGLVRVLAEQTLEQRGEELSPETRERIETLIEK